MKKKYIKPVIVFESFQLDASVASGCNLPLNHSVESCTYEGGQFFNHRNCQFDLAGADEDGNDTICYHGPIYTGTDVFITS